MTFFYLLFLGCSPSLQGEWDGVCVFSDQNTEHEVDVISQIQQDNGYSLEGNLWLQTWEDDEFEGSLSGDHNGKYVFMRSSLETAFGPYQFKIEAERVGQNLEGDCFIQAPDSVGSLIGNIILSK